MSTTEIRQPSSFESIPLQTLTGPSMLPNDTEDVQPDIDTAQAGQESYEPQIEFSDSTVDPVPEEAGSEHAELPATEPNSVFDKWQLRLNATQVLIGVLAFAGFLAMIKFTIIDHYINNDSLKLSQWTAWMTFRDECRALLSETRDIGPDCQDVLYQPLSKPPIPMAESPSHDEKNTTLAGRIARDNASTRERLSDWHILGVSIAEPTLLSGISVLLLAFGLGCIGYVATRRFFPRRKSRRIDTHQAWVPDHMARLHPDGSKGYTTAQDTVSWSEPLRKRVIMRKITRIGEQYEESAISRSFRKRLHPSTDTESLLENWGEAGQHDEKQENVEPGYESEWLPTASSSENVERLSPLASEYLRRVEFLLNKLKVLGCDYFAFERIDEHAGLEPFWTTAKQEKCFCAFSRQSASPTLGREISTSDSTFLQRLFEDLKAVIASESAWLVEIPKLNFDSVTVCMVNVALGQKISARSEKEMWKYWQSGKLGTADFGYPEAPCLRLMNTYASRSVRLIFENVTIQDYSFILDRVGMRDSEKAHVSSCASLIGGSSTTLHTDIIKKVMLAASEGLLHAHVWRQEWENGSLMSIGRYIDNYDPLDRMGEGGQLVPTCVENADNSTNSDTTSIHVEAPASSPPVQIQVEKAGQTQESLTTEHTIEPVLDASTATGRRRVRQTVAAWARVRFRRKGRNKAEPSAEIST